MMQMVGAFAEFERAMLRERSSGRSQRLPEAFSRKIRSQPAYYCEPMSIAQRYRHVCCYCQRNLSLFFPEHHPLCHLRPTPFHDKHPCIPRPPEEPLLRQ